MPKEKIPSLRDFLNIVFKHQVAIILWFLVVFATVTTITYLWPFTYEASSKILVKFDRGTLPLSPASPSPAAPLTMRRMEEDILSEIEILSNKYLIEWVVRGLWDDFTRVPIEKPESILARTKVFLKATISSIRDIIVEWGYRLDLIEKSTPFKAKVNHVRRNLKIRAIKDSNVIEVKFRSGDPELSANFVNALTDLYLEQHIKVHKSPRAFEFFGNQRDLLEENLKNLEDKLKEFKQRWSISSMESQRKLLLENLSTLLFDYKNIQREIMETKETTKWLRKTLSERTNYRFPETIPPAIWGADIIYQDLEKEMLSKQSYLEGLKAKSAQQEKTLEHYRSMLRTLDEKELELKRMEREANILEENYKRYLTKLEDARISDAMDLERISNVSVIEPATIPSGPVRRFYFIPNRVLHILVSMVLGVVVGFIYAFLVEHFNHTFHSREEVEQTLNIPCLSSIPKE